MTRSSIRAYMILEDVEFLHDGMQEQQREQAAVPQQHASVPRENTPPMVRSELFAYNHKCAIKNSCWMEIDWPQRSHYVHVHRCIVRVSFVVIQGRWKQEV